MVIRRLVGRWQGVLLSLIGLVATIWLGITGQLALYIHPRYFVFTVVMAVIAGVLALAAFAFAPTEHDAHDHSDAHGAARGDAHDHSGVHRSRWGWLWPLGSVLTMVAAVVGLLVLPPSTLTTATVAQRDLNGSASALTLKAPALSGKGDYSAFTVRDWASLLRSGAGQDFFADKTATVTGFISADKTDPNVFFVTRFVVTCCAVDAQPIGVPVYHPGWQNEYKTDSWVTVTSGFRANPNSASREAIVLIPDTIQSTTQPAQPYVY
ncbi:TIGR03943 family putative permease subunit [Arthrobacter bambusae]|uniref:TIGR03943 family putative permease subunit n=1 Tax=Arthrobacter bambusae TaxID=1338426 RepID=UPI0027834724|nr:TIGR03943 family protein [Arthrobacter bambusae]MDQ0031490.1 putative repeat protein (TIGR03943 family) [Arthrobacter bambusae]MDQ0099622.1 putative repeat protein (TIGR03943 family) [Arthrobacter bambusae]